MRHHFFEIFAVPIKWHGSKLEIRLEWSSNNNLVAAVKKTSDLIWQDTQHQTLFVLIEELKSTTSKHDVFARLSNFAENHFALEETYMLKLHYPKMEEHIATHNKFRHELQSMIQNKKEFDAQARETVSIFLKEWLKWHIFGIDKDLEAFILNSDQK